MTAALEATAITVRIGPKTLLDEVSLSLETGEIVALVGPNGAGKSTLLRVLSGDLGARAGIVRLKGRELKSYGAGVLAGHRAVLSQSISVAFPFTVADIVRMGAGDRRGRRIAELVDAMLAEVDLDGFHDRVITTLSGGEQQRAHFARILVQLSCGEATYGPGVLLLDEPTASLDLRHQLDVIAATKRFAARGATVARSASFPPAQRRSSCRTPLASSPRLVRRRRDTCGNRLLSLYPFSPLDRVAPDEL